MDTVLVRTEPTGDTYINIYMRERERKSERGGGVGEERRGRDTD